MNGAIDYYKGGYMEGLAVGRVVHYVAYGTPKGEFPAMVHRAAIITEVEDKEEGIVSLCVLNPTGVFLIRICNSCDCQQTRNFALAGARIVHAS